MSIQYSGNTGLYSVTTGSSNPSLDIENFLLTELVVAGWTLTQTSAQATLTFTANPAASSTFTIDSSTYAQTYTFVTSLTSSNQILIGVNQAATVANAFAGLTGGAGSGTTYSSVFTVPPNCTITTAGGVTIEFTYNTPGSAGNGAASTISGTIHATFANTTFTGGSNIFTSAITPQGLAMRVQEYLTAGNFYNPGTGITLIPGTRDGARVPSASSGYVISNSVPSASTTYKMIACKYHFLLFVPGSTATTVIGNGSGCGVPYITSNLVASTISAATNEDPVVCTIANHGFTNGDTVLVVGATGLTTINGINTITVIDTNTFSIPVSGNGTYNANSGFCSDTTIGNTICEAIWSSQTAGGGPSNIRNAPRAWFTPFSDVNGATLTNDGSSAQHQIVTPSVPASNDTTTSVQWYDNTYLMSEPFVMFGIASGATPRIIGQLYDCAYIITALTVDQTAVFDSPSHTFWAVGVEPSNQKALMFATTP